MTAPIYWGVSIPGITSTLLNNFESLAGGKHVSIIGYGRTWYSGALYGQSGGAYSSFPSSYATLINGRGGTSMYDWIQGNDFVAKLDDPSFNLRSVYLNGTHDAYIDAHAAAIKALGFPIIIRIGHEMNGNWYESYDEAGPNNLGNGSGEFIKMWQYIVNRFEAAGCTHLGPTPNVLWVFCPNIMSNTGSTSRPLSQFYPGDDYVDWMSLDGYNQAGSGGTWLSMQQVFEGGAGGLQNSIANIKAVGDSRKPFFIGETGCNSYDETGTVNATKKAQWFTDAFTTYIPSQPYIQGFIYSNYGQGDPTGDWALDDPSSISPTVPNAFAAGIASSYYLKGGTFTLPTGKILPHWLSPAVTDHYRVAVNSEMGRVTYFRGTESSGTLADDTGNGHTATAEGTVTYGNTNVVPANTSDTSLGIAGGTTSDFTTADADAFSVTATGQLYIEFSFVINSLPSSGNMHVVAKGSSGEYEYSFYVTSTGAAVWNVWDLTAANGSANQTGASAIVTGKRYLAQLSFQTSPSNNLSMVLSSEDGGSWGNVGNFAGSFSLTPGNGTAPFDIGRRAGSGDQSLNGHIGHVIVNSQIPVTASMQTRYNSWLAAPAITSPAATPGTASAVITWTTNEASSSWVEYGTTTSYGSDSGLPDPALVTSHSVTLSGLAAGTYHYRIHSKNTGGTESVTTDSTFTVVSSSITFIWVSVT